MRIDCLLNIAGYSKEIPNSIWKYLSNRLLDILMVKLPNHVSRLEFYKISVPSLCFVSRGPRPDK